MRSLDERVAFAIAHSRTFPRLPGKRHEHVSRRLNEDVYLELFSTYPPDVLELSCAPPNRLSRV